MNNKNPRYSSLLLSFALVAASQPLPLFAAAVLGTQAGPAIVPAGVRGVAITPALNSASGLSAPIGGIGLTSSLALPKGAPTLVPSAFAAAGITSDAQTALDSALAVPGAQAEASAIPGAVSAQAGLAPALQAVSAEVAAAERSPAKQAPRSLIGRVAGAIASKLNFGRLFDSAPTRAAMDAPAGIAGILPMKSPTLPEGIVLDQAPQSPNAGTVSGGVTLNNFEIPGARGVGGVFDGPTVLQATPSSEADIERALRSMIDADPAKYGVPNTDLATVHVKLIEGTGNQADTFFAYFRQVKDGVPIHGSYLSFTVKVVQGRPVVMGAMANLYPTANVATTPAFSDDELKEKVWQRIGIPPQADAPLIFLERKIIYSKGAWHTANLYTLENLPVMIAVDVVTGDAFAWDPRMGLTSGRVSGNNVEKGATKPTSKLIEVPLGNLTIKVGNKTVTTDRDGNIPLEVTEETQITVKLDGLYAVVNNKAGAPLQITATLKPGVQTKLVFNKDSALDEVTIAQIQAYYLVNHAHDWLADNKIKDKRLDQKLPINVNINDECNAYYTPGRPSENYFASSDNCVNSAYDTVVSHEHGHFVDDMLGGIVNGGLSEGWGDILSMYQLNNPIIGEGFLKVARNGVDYIRHGENTRQYSANDEAHDAGEVWGGFAWKLRKALIASLGEAGDAVARAIVLPTLYAKASDIPAAIAQVLLNDMDKDGNIPHEAEIRAAAKIHGITLPKNPGIFTRFVSWLSTRFTSNGNI
ncbi:MAG: hypothetical protein AAB320_07225 [Elusimicrobiota bacterium]